MLFLPRKAFTSLQVLQVYKFSSNWNQAVGVSFYSLGSLKIIIAPSWHQSYEEFRTCKYIYRCVLLTDKYLTIGSIIKELYCDINLFGFSVKLSCVL